MIELVIEVRVRSLVVMNWVASRSKAVTAERRSNAGTSRAARSLSATQPRTSAIESPPSAAACSSAARTRRAWASHRSASPEAARVAAVTMSVARSPAVTGSAHPVNGSNVIVEAIPPSPTGLNTHTGPWVRSRIGAHSSNRSVRVEVTTAAPGASSARPASQPVLQADWKL